MLLLINHYLLAALLALRVGKIERGLRKDPQACSLSYMTREQCYKALEAREPNEALCFSRLLRSFLQRLCEHSSNTKRAVRAGVFLYPKGERWYFFCWLCRCFLQAVLKSGEGTGLSHETGPAVARPVLSSGFLVGTARNRILPSALSLSCYIITVSQAGLGRKGP